jgi:site-specific DNA-methyltransferase (adenine-specific)
MSAYKTDLLDLRCIDCMDLMREMPDKAFELALVDPPYGINSEAGRMQRLNGGGGKLKNRVLNTAKEISWDNAIPTEEYFAELFRVSQNQIIWGGNYFPLPPTRCVIAWDKCQPWENFSQWEMAWTSFDSPARLFQFDNRTGGKIHPTQKPVALYRWLLHNYAKPGDRILDTHLGSMSSAIACHYAGYHLTGTELDPDYFAAGVKRVQAETAQQELAL